MRISGRLDGNGNVHPIASLMLFLRRNGPGRMLGNIRLQERQVSHDAAEMLGCRESAPRDVDEHDEIGRRQAR